MKRPIYVLASILKDKDSEEMLAILNENADKLFVTSFDFYRAWKAEDLLKVKYGQVINDWRNLLLELVKEDQSTIIVCGSLYFISEVRDFLDNYRLGL